MSELIAILVVVVILLAAILYNSFAWGYVASVIYNWCILTVFPNAPHLTWIQLAGMMFLVNCFVRDSTIHSIKDEYKDNNKGLLTELLSPWMTLFVAWIFKLFFL